MKKTTSMETDFRRKLRTNMEAFLKETEFKLMNPTPNLCPTCLGGEYPVKFEHKEGEKDCKICSSKFIVAMWKTDPNTERRIEICYSCGELRNICQLCNQECPRSDPLKIDTSSRLSVRPPRLMKLKISRLIPDDGLGCCHSGLREYCRVCLMDRERERREMRT